MTNKKLYEIDHPYYCSEPPECFWGGTTEYEDFDSFLEVWENNNMDLNLLFRWDWETTDKDEFYDGNDLYLYYVLQRKGVIRQVTINNIKKCEEPKVKEFLKKHWEHYKLLWEGIE